MKITVLYCCFIFSKLKYSSCTKWQIIHAMLKWTTCCALLEWSHRQKNLDLRTVSTMQHIVTILFTTWLLKKIVGCWRAGLHQSSWMENKHLAGKFSSPASKYHFGFQTSLMFALNTLARNSLRTRASTLK